MIDRFNPAEPIQSGELGLRGDWNLMYRLAAQHDYIARLYSRLVLLNWPIIALALLSLVLLFATSDGDYARLWNVSSGIFSGVGMGLGFTASALGRHLKTLQMDMDNLRHRIRLRGVDL